MAGRRRICYRSIMNPSQLAVAPSPAPAERHDGAPRGSFVYAVRTTGIYCVPGCPSRTPRPENVETFSDGAAARAAGYRACKRCKPDRASDTDARMLEACALIEASVTPPTLRSLAAKLDLSESYLQRRFTQQIGVSPRRYAEMIRHRRLRAGLRERASVTEAIFESGYESASAVYERSSDLGMTPVRFRRGGPAEDIHYAIVSTTFGLVLVAATSRGICRVDIDAEADVLEARLRHEFARANLAKAPERLHSATSLLVAYLAGDGAWPQLPVDVRGTAFQIRVWDTLRTIASGKALTYTELAAAVGSPRAARAVARACAGNPIALLIPCHRIVPASGGVGGYRWGSENKARLLKMERASRATE